MNRYLYSFLLMTMMANVLLLVPDILFESEHYGALSSMLLAIGIGGVLANLFINALRRFPGRDLPEIFSLFLSKWIRIPIVYYLGVMWFIAGGFVVIEFSIIIRRFINPDVPIYLNSILMLLVAGWGATRSTKTIFYFTEILLALNIPFIFFILYKTISNPYFNWDQILLLMDYAWAPPTWGNVSAATYIFIGYINFAIFNREFNSKYKFSYGWVIPILGFFVLLTSFFIPIGLLGPEGVLRYVFPWGAAADTPRMEYGFIERMFYIFILLYFSLALLFAIITWHVGLELLKSTLPKRNWIPPSIIGFFFLVTITALNWVDEFNMFDLLKQWLNIRFASELLLVAMVYFFSKRRKVT